MVCRLASPCGRGLSAQSLTDITDKNEYLWQYIRSTFSSYGSWLLSHVRVFADSVFVLATKNSHSCISVLDSWYCFWSLNRKQKVSFQWSRSFTVILYSIAPSRKVFVITSAELGLYVCLFFCLITPKVINIKYRNLSVYKTLYM